MTSNSLQPTTYSQLRGALDGELAELNGDYQKNVNALLAAMRKHFPALCQGTNPIMQDLDKWSAQDLTYIIQEYSGFSNAAIHMFLEARIRNHWPGVTSEIVRNMDEEMGVLTRNVPHLELMRAGYRDELGIETDNVARSTYTQDFIARMMELFCTSDNVFLAGCLLAFEGTAVDEFRMVEQILRQYQCLRGADISHESLTGTYIAGHVTPGEVDPASDPEMDHYRGMMDAIGRYVGSDGGQRLGCGFFAVCLELNRWWEEVAAGAYQRVVRNQLRAGMVQRTDVQRVYAHRSNGHELTT